MGKDALDLCGHYRYRERVKSPLTEARVVALHPPGKDIMLAPIDRIYRTRVNVGIELVDLCAS